MLREIPCSRSSRRSSRAHVFMGELESRTMFSTASTAHVVHIGPSQAIKTLSAAKWPDKGDAPVQFVLDYSSKPYDVGTRVVNGNLTIVPADMSKRPTLRLGSAFSKAARK